MIFLLCADDTYLYAKDEKYENVFFCVCIVVYKCPVYLFTPVNVKWDTKYLFHFIAGTMHKNSILFSVSREMLQAFNSLNSNKIRLVYIVHLVCAQI